jgi:hypothetical protein
MQKIGMGFVLLDLMVMSVELTIWFYWFDMVGPFSCRFVRQHAHLQAPDLPCSGGQEPYVP